MQSRTMLSDGCLLSVGVSASGTALLGEHENDEWLRVHRANNRAISPHAAAAAGRTRVRRPVYDDTIQVEFIGLSVLCSGCAVSYHGTALAALRIDVRSTSICAPARDASRPDRSPHGEQACHGKDRVLNGMAVCLQFLPVDLAFLAQLCVVRVRSQHDRIAWAAAQQTESGEPAAIQCADGAAGVVSAGPRHPRNASNPRPR